MHEKFNGKLVMEWTGLRDVQLGHFIKKFKDEWSEDDLYEMEKGDIERHVLQMLQVQHQDQKEGGASM